MKAILVDDEIYCTEVLQILLTKYCPQVEVIQVFNHPEDALPTLRQSPPDILFLDIEMPRMNGFDLLKQVHDLRFHIIFTTAYDQYALKAFKFNAIDYLLKPIQKEELVESVNRVSKSAKFDNETINYADYLRKNPIPDRILLPIGNEIIFVKTSNILCCEADGSYCKVYCTDQKKPYLLSKNLKEIEDLLNNPIFFRPHYSWLVNESHIQKITKGEGMEIILTHQIRIPVARGKRQEVMDRLLS